MLNSAQKKVRAYGIIAFACACIMPLAAVAAPSLIPSGGLPGCNFTTGIMKASCIIEFIKHLIRIAFVLIGSFFLIKIIFAGYYFAIGSATGNKDTGKNMLKWAIIGFIIASLSFFIIDFFISALGTG